MKRLCPLLLLFVVGCASTPAMQQLDEIIKSDILSPSHQVSAAEKKQIKSALIESKKELKANEKKINELSVWKKWGKLGIACLSLFLVLSLIFKTLF